MDKQELSKIKCTEGVEVPQGGGGRVGTGCSKSSMEGAKGCDFMGMDGLGNFWKVPEAALKFNGLH